MIDGKKSRTADHGAPTAPFAVQSPVKQSAKKILFRERCEPHCHDSIGCAPVGHSRQQFLRLANHFGARRNMTQELDVAQSKETQQQPSCHARREKSKQLVLQPSVTTPPGWCCGGFGGGGRPVPDVAEGNATTTEKTGYPHRNERSTDGISHSL